MGSEETWLKFLEDQYMNVIGEAVEATKGLHEWLSQNDIIVDHTSAVEVAVPTLAVLILVTILLYCCRSSGKTKKQKGNAILIYGPVGSGKTCIFYRLRENTFPDTITSTTPNEDKISIGGSKQTVIDFPGHQRLKAQLNNAYLKRAGKILFVLDASNLKAEPARVAQQLYDILTRAYVSEAAVPVVVACNKRDDPTSVTPEQARSILQTELEKLRSTRSANPSLAGLQDQEDKNTVSIGVVGKPFRWEDLEHDIDFVGCSAFKGDLKAIESVLA